MGQDHPSGMEQRAIDNQFVSVDAAIKDYKLNLDMTLKAGNIPR